MTKTTFINLLIQMGFIAVYYKKEDFEHTVQKPNEARVYLEWFGEEGARKEVCSVVLSGDNDGDDVTFTFINGKAVQRGCSS